MLHFVQSGSLGPYAAQLHREKLERRARMSTVKPVAVTKQQPERDPEPIDTVIYPAHAFADEVSPEPDDVVIGLSNRARLREIQNLICSNLKIQRAEMLSARRDRAMVLARQVAMYLCKRHTPLSFPDIGRRFGGRDHTTIIHACRRAEKIMSGEMGSATSAQWGARDSDLVRKAINQAEATISTWSEPWSTRERYPARSGK